MCENQRVCDIIETDENTASGGHVMALGDNIRKAREALGMNQTQLAELIGVSQQQIAKYELDRQDMPVSRFMQLAKVLQIHPSKLLDDDWEKKRVPIPDDDI